MKKRNIYSNRSQELLGLFEQAGNNSKVMCVPIDYAKKDHVALFCNGYGDIIRKPFAVKNSPVGVTYLLEQVTFVGIYDEHFSRQYGFWRPYVEQVIYRYLDCGDLHNGFARVKCKDCGHEYLLAFSCKRRHFCPSWHQKRVVEFKERLSHISIGNR